MKKSIFILSLYFAIGTFTSYAQDTLKLKTITTYYGEVNGGYFDRIGNLNGSTINMDSISVFYPEVSVVNISNDTFSSGVGYEVIMDFFIYADTGLLLYDRNISQRAPLFIDFFPNDTASFFFMSFKFSDIMSYNESIGIYLEQMSYWKLITGISYTSKDGTFTDSVFYAGADTSIFYVTKTPVSIREVEQFSISVFPNPVRSQFTVTNTEDANITLYNILGQEVKRTQGTTEQTTIYTDNLPAGIYVLKVEKEGAVFTKKVQISD